MSEWDDEIARAMADGWHSGDCTQHHPWAVDSRDIAIALRKAKADGMRELADVLRINEQFGGAVSMGQIIKSAHENADKIERGEL